LEIYKVHFIFLEYKHIDGANQLVVFTIRFLKNYY